MNDKIQANLNAQVEAAQLNHCKVLLCEDDYCSAEIVTFFLKEIRITVEWAKDGLEGFAKFSKSSPGYYDLILMDTSMPNLNGYMVTRFIRKLNRPDAVSISIIALTEDTSESAGQHYKRVGMNGHIIKPVLPLTFSQTIIKLLSSART